MRIVNSTGSLPRDIGRMLERLSHHIAQHVATHTVKLAGEAIKELEQPHAHVMLTMRQLDSDGFGAKSRHEWVEDPTGRTHADGRPVMVVSNRDSWNCPEYFERCREDWERIANDALARGGSEARIDRRSLLERGLSRLPEPALRLAWYLKDLYGSMKERFGHYQVAKHYQAVEKASQTAFQKMRADPDPNPTKHAQTTRRFFHWFDRQLARLEPAPRLQDLHQQLPGRDR